MKKPMQKVNEIKRQRAYVLEQAKKCEALGNLEGAAKWEHMALAYEISLQILLEEGDWMTEEKEAAHKAEVTDSIQGSSIKEVEELIEIAQETKNEFKSWDWIDENRMNLTIKAYREYIWKLEGDEE
jgi:hypothetical protein